ncbi:unnamed protein product [Leptosia nina]|uniref:Uncharacterized protein n=1 Tax=Leptosia nina TaxID=320188 RepID=A0AAV1JS12_9NEOP
MCRWRAAWRRPNTLNDKPTAKHRLCHSLGLTSPSGLAYASLTQRRAARRIGDGEPIRPATARTDPSTAASQSHMDPTLPSQTPPPPLTPPQKTPYCK